MEPAPPGEYYDLGLGACQEEIASEHEQAAAPDPAPGHVHGRSHDGRLGQEGDHAGHGGHEGGGGDPALWRLPADMAQVAAAGAPQAPNGPARIQRKRFMVVQLQALESTSQHAQYLDVATRQEFARLKREHEARVQAKDDLKDICRALPEEERMVMGDGEKGPCGNVKRKSAAPVARGFKTPRPAVMSVPEHAVKPQERDAEDSDDEWTPRRPVNPRGALRVRRSKQQEVSSSQIPLTGQSSSRIQAQAASGAPLGDGPSREESSGAGDAPEARGSERAQRAAFPPGEASSRGQSCGGKSGLGRAQTEGKVYNLRQKRHCGYQEVSEPQDDDYLYCELCRSYFLDRCAAHGPPTFIKDRAVHRGHPNRSALTLPPGLSIRKSGIPKAGLGVWNEAFELPLGLHFGPYEGHVTNDAEAADSGYSWQVFKGRKAFEYVDAKDKSQANWMRYVNCARDDEEQNLMAHQYHGQIYYRTCQVVKPGCELLVWYGEEFAEKLGILCGSKEDQKVRVGTRGRPSSSRKQKKNKKRLEMFIVQLLGPRARERPIRCSRDVGSFSCGFASPGPFLWLLVCVLMADPPAAFQTDICSVSGTRVGASCPV